MTEKGVSCFYHEFQQNSSIINYLGKYIRKQLREEKELLNEEDKELLLNWPIVYLHGWKEENGEIYIYVGETSNLAQRIDQHSNKDSFYIDDEDWHSDWLRAIRDGRAFSWFFGSRDMNKSLCLDIENSLFMLLKQMNSLTVTTKTTRKQNDYSNKQDRNKILEDIWKVLENSKKLELYAYSKMDCRELSKGSADSKYSDDLEAKLLACKRDLDFSNNLLKECRMIDLLMAYPVVYIYIWKRKDLITNEEKVYTYVGETDDLRNRASQHLKQTEQWESEWKDAGNKENAFLIIFGNRNFNGSMTLDIENRLIDYTNFLGSSRNERHNEQGEYNNKCQMFSIFCVIIDQLIEIQRNLPEEFRIFRTLKYVREHCLLLSSPFYNLTESQKIINKDILNIIGRSLDCNEDKNTLLIVYGGAGTGKTILVANLLFEIIDSNRSCKLIVNNKELAPAYKKMIDVWKLGSSISKKGSEIVFYANEYFNTTEKHDILLIDEGHLLNTQNYMRATSQIDKMFQNSKITILIFDPNQFVDKFKSWSADFSSIEKIKKAFMNIYTKHDIICYELHQQLRMICADTTSDWLCKLTKKGHTLEKLKSKYKTCTNDVRIAKDDAGYLIGVCNTPEQFHKEFLKIKKADAYSAMIATYDWEYNSERPTISLQSNSHSTTEFYWHRTGNGGRKLDDEQRLTLDSWIKQTKEDEVGSVHDIQGFDLNYAFVIIGPSIQYEPRRGRKRIKQVGIQVQERKHRTNHEPELILNELRILLTRGIKGIYIYADDQNLREKLWEALSD